MGAPGIAPAPLGDDAASLIERLEAVLPITFFFKGKNESLRQSVFFWRIASDIFLSQAILGNDPALQSRAKDQAIVVTKLEAGCLS
jgi:hypothetical protein